MKLPILRSNTEDQILYQTERYNEETFGYEVPIKEEGDYVLVLKFAEVYFAQSQQKVTTAPCLSLWCELLAKTVRVQVASAALHAGERSEVRH